MLIVAVIICVLVLYVALFHQKVLLYICASVYNFPKHFIRKRNVKSHTSLISVRSIEDVTHEYKNANDITVGTDMENEYDFDKMPGHCETFILILEDKQFQERTLYRIKKGCLLKFQLGPSLFGKKVSIFTNAPDYNKPFIRDVYQQLKWTNPNASDDSLYAVLKLNNAGSYHYYFCHNSSTEKIGAGYFTVDPVISLGNEILPLDCMQCITVLSKNLGSFEQWESKLQVAKNADYNVIHFTPIQELGASNSAYSLQNQHKLNETFKGSNKTDVTIDDVIRFTNKLRQNWKMLSICDIVLNHTANESEWLLDHPECTYNMINCPYLKSAYLLDITLHIFSMEVKKGLWELSGIPSVIDTENHLTAMRYHLLEKALPSVKIHELYTVNVEFMVDEFLLQCRKIRPPSTDTRSNSVDLKIIHDPQYRRLSATVDLNVALERYNVYRNDCFDEETRLLKCAADFKSRLEQLNKEQISDIQTCLVAAVDACIAGCRYSRIQADGPKWKDISVEQPLFTRYFTDYNEEALEEHMYSENGRFIMAHNGWVMSDNPLNNFAAADSRVYLRRELIAWGDSVKLRYGESPEDCPYLWQHMRRYVEDTAHAFDGIRLDNCHSTPIHVAEYMLDAARRIRPDLYVVAELFTDSPDTDNVFVNRLGITSLIRESMSAWDSHELGRLVHRYGGEPVGAFMKPQTRHLVPSIAHALFLDMSHDNPSPVEKRSVFDLLPSTALVSMACCASGSTLGYDQLVPHHINVVTEERIYLGWSEEEVNMNTGIIAAKKVLNHLHYNLGKQGYSQVFVDQINQDVICVTRHNGKTHESVVLLAYTAFRHPNESHNIAGRNITISGSVESIILEAFVEHKSGNRFNTMQEFQRHDRCINGLTEYKLRMKSYFDSSEVSMVKLQPSGKYTSLIVTEKFKPGSVIAIKFVQNEKVMKAVELLRSDLNLQPTIKTLTLANLNKVLYCCDEEDGGCYNLPNYGPFVYCGIQGIISLLGKISTTDDLGHPLCEHLRQGHWLMDYTANRLKNKSETRQLGEKLEEIFNSLKDIPHYLVPCYFDYIVSQLHEKLIQHTISLMSTFIRTNSKFCKQLALGSVQFGGIVDSSPLPPLSKSVLPPISSDTAINKQICVSLSAGLPHFATGYMRNWGRDTFISLRGLFLLTGRFDEAKYIILAYGGCLRHGLIPNLLDGGNNPRYNCRDAFWWWLYTIKSYASLAPNGEAILNSPVNRLFPTDDSPSGTSVEQPLYDVIQEGINRHFQGVCFRERNAGFDIDAHMKSPGFDNQIGIHPVTGFVFGGNEWNCGTWMDKMGSSDKAGNRGKPATPRDGSAIELVALSKVAASWLASLYQRKVYPYSGITRTNSDGSITSWSYEEWAIKIQSNFEKHFWISTIPQSNEPRPDLIHHRGIYKDTVGATQPWSDFQFRCNYSVAMAVAPELFQPENAWTALQMAKKLLLGPLGMKTLDEEDWAYNGYYDNSNDSTDSKIANGFNYHQGPEWLWPVGYFLRARLYFAGKIRNNSNTLNDVLYETKSYLSHHYVHLQNSAWKGLPELTNKDGADCPFSCPTQAWSMASILEVIEEISVLEEASFK